MGERSPEIRGACGARPPYFRYFFTNCVIPIIDKFDIVGKFKNVALGKIDLIKFTRAKKFSAVLVEAGIFHKALREKLISIRDFE